MLEQRIYSLEEIKNLPDSQVVVVIDGGVYNVTEFLALHPGGSEILLKFNRRDGSKAFHATKHSLQAKRMLPKYLMGVLAGSEEQYQKSIEDIPKEDETLASTLRKKLITHEDKFHLHKILGSIVLAHLGARTLFFMLGAVVYLVSGSDEIISISYRLDPAWLLIGFALIHGALSLSSLQFFIPKKSNQSKPMIHQVTRAHSICFGLRAVFCMIIYVLIQDNPALLHLALSVVILMTFITADILTETLTDKDDSFNTTASMPYWFGVTLRRQKAHKFLYGYGQFLATYVCLISGYLGALYTLAPIQGAVFLMTLVRKNIISARTYHNVYLASLFLPVPFALMYLPVQASIGLSVALVLFYVRTLGVNKYLLWIPPLLLYNWLLLPEAHQTLFINLGVLSFVLAIVANLVYLKFTKQAPVDKNNRIIARKRITRDSFEITIRTRLPISLLPGQHVMIRFDDQLERKYTPIHSQYIEKTKQTLLCLRIKEYKLEGKQTASSYLANCPVGTVLDLHGPVGEKYFNSDTNSIVEGISSISLEQKQKDIYLLSAGSGITPLFQIAKYICEQGSNINLITCDQSPDHLMLATEITELKQRFPKSLQWTSVFSFSDVGFTGVGFTQSDKVINERLSPQKLHAILGNNIQKLVIICGPNEWQQMVTKTLSSSTEIKSQLIIW